MSASHRLLTAPAVALALLAAAPSYAQEPPQQRLLQQRRPQQPHPGQQGPRPQEAQRRHGGNGAGIAAGVIGGLAAGALLGGVLSGRGAAEPEGGPGYGGGCPLVRQPVYDGSGRFAGYQAVPSC